MTTELLDVDQAAQFLHVQTSTIRDWILKKKIAYVKLGRRVFVRRQTLEDLIEQSVVPAGQAKAHR